MSEDPQSKFMLRWLDPGQYPVGYRKQAKPFYQLGCKLHYTLPRGAEKRAAIRRLIQAQEASMRLAMGHDRLAALLDEAKVQA